MSVADRIRAAFNRQPPMRVDGPTVVARVAAVRRFLQAAEGHLPESALVAARTVVEVASARLERSGEHTVVALAGATGSGKSSIFNAIAGLQLSEVGVRRPTTGVAHACVWGGWGSGSLLDWLGVPPTRRFERESALDGDDEAALRGLILLDLPDFDSVEDAHRLEVDRLLRLVDLVVWVLDPQKYADELVHEQYLRNFQRHRDVTIVVLNQADRLGRVNSERCLTDLRQLLDADGLDGIAVLATSVKGWPGLSGLRAALEASVAAHEAALQRLAGDLGGVIEELLPLVAVAADERLVDPRQAGRLVDALASAAGVPAVAEAVERAYRHRAVASTGWPVARWLRRLRPDPLRRLHLDSGGGAGSGRNGGLGAGGLGAGAALVVPSLPEATAAQRAAVALAARELADSTGEGLPEGWLTAVRQAAQERRHDVPDALDVAVAGADLGLSRPRAWWRLVGAAQWLFTLAALAGLAWLGLRYLLFAVGLPELPGPRVGRVPLGTVLLFGGLLAGLLLSTLTGPLVRAGARRARARAEALLRSAVAEVAERLVVTPVRAVLHGYAEARDALTRAQ